MSSLFLYNEYAFSRSKDENAFLKIRTLLQYEILQNKVQIQQIQYEIPYEIVQKPTFEAFDELQHTLRRIENKFVNKSKYTNIPTKFYTEHFAKRRFDLFNLTFDAVFFNLIFDGVGGIISANRTFRIFLDTQAYVHFKPFTRGVFIYMLGVGVCTLWFLAQMVAHFTMSTYGVISYFDLLKAVGSKERVVQSVFLWKRPITSYFRLYTCATCSEQPSYISTMMNIKQNCTFGIFVHIIFNEVKKIDYTYVE